MRGPHERPLENGVELHALVLLACFSASVIGLPLHHAVTHAGYGDHVHGPGGHVHATHAEPVAPEQAREEHPSASSDGPSIDRPEHGLGHAQPLLLPAGPAFPPLPVARAADVRVHPRAPTVPPRRTDPSFAARAPPRA